MVRDRVAFVTTLLAGLMLLFLIPVGVRADSFTVTDLKDEGSGSPSFCTNSLYKDQFCTLRAAINAANALRGGNHIIVLKDQPYTLRSTLQITSAVTIQGVSAGATVIQRPCDESIRDLITGLCGAGDFRIFEVTPLGRLSLVRVTVRGGQAGQGGGIKNEGHLDLIESTVMRNTAHDDGGGIYNTGDLWLSGSTVRDNFVQHYSGGGIYNAGSAGIDKSTISGNQIAAFEGKGKVGRGGGIYNVYNLNAKGAGGLVIVNSTISGNKVAPNYFLVEPGKRVQPVFDQTNLQPGYGGGFFNSGRQAVLNNVTITANFATFAGGVYAAEGPDFQFGNTIIAGNKSSTSSGADCIGDLTTRRGNLVGDPDPGSKPVNYPCNIMDWPSLPSGAPHDQIGGKSTIGPIPPGDVFVMDTNNPTVPLLQDNGGLTCTHALCRDGNCLHLRESRAIDSAWQDGHSCASSKDQRGVMRDHCDIGAFESAGPVVPSGLTCVEH